MKKTTLRTMISEQHKMNKKASGHLWPIYIHKTNKIINWKRAIHLETAELIESYPWKHWKNVDAPIDTLNVAIETSDIWHFVLSLFIADYITNLDIINKKSTEEEVDKLIEKTSKKMAKQLKKHIKYGKKSAFFENYSTEDIDETLFPFELFALNTNPVNDDSSVDEIVEMFFDITHNVLDLNIESIYFGKMVLNNFRNDNGYEAGTYIKTWHLNDDRKVEDNVVMFELIQEDLTKEELYQMLEEVYRNLK